VSGKPLFLLDVREPDEFRHGHIAGAKLVPLGELSRRLHEVPPGQEIVCICATGQRSVQAVRLITAAGYSASSLDNGMVGWQMARLPVEKGMTP
jgi:rhodanese-related sulfurtransferase